MAACSPALATIDKYFSITTTLHYFTPVYHRGRLLRIPPPFSAALEHPLVVIQYSYSTPVRAYGDFRLVDSWSSTVEQGRCFSHRPPLSPNVISLEACNPSFDHWNIIAHPPPISRPAGQGHVVAMMVEETAKMYGDLTSQS